MTSTAILLPPIPAPTSPTAAAISFWTPSISSAFSRLTSPSTLFLAVHPPFSTTCRCASFPAAEKLLTALYSLVYSLGGAIHDVHVVFLSSEDAAFGPVMSVEQLADLREWEQVLVPRGDTGYLLQGQFLAATSSPGLKVNYVEPGTFVAVDEIAEAPRECCEQEHAIVAVGGTFDHFHLGHRLLLSCTAYMCAGSAERLKIIVGVSGDELLQNKKHAEHLEPWRKRAERSLAFVENIMNLTPWDCRIGEPQEGQEKITSLLREFKEGERKELEVEISELHDPFGPTITEEDVTALVVTRETESGGEAVNKKRQEQGWKPLDIGVVDLLMDGENKLSSTDLRLKAGEAKAAGQES